jgi:type II secretory pathway pseudopilin PulG
MLIKNLKDEQGQLLIEFILAVGLMAILLTSGLNILGPSLKISSQSEEKEFVAALIQEQFEVIRSIRNENWSALAVNGTYHYEDIDEDEAGLTFLANPILYDNKYEVSIILDDVYRDSNMEILETGNLDQIDTNSRKVTVQVSWDSYGNEKIVSQSMYLTNWDDF